MLMTSVEFYILFFIFAMMCAIPVIKDWAAGRLDFFNPRNIFAAFFFLYYGMRTLDLYLSDSPLTFYDLGSGEVKKGELTDALKISILGLLFLYLGYYGRVVVAVERFLPTFQGLDWNSNRAKDVVYLLLLVGSGAGLYLFQLGGGFLYYLENINYIRLSVLTDVGYLKFMVNLLSVAVLIVCILRYQNRESSVFLYLLAMLSVVLNLVVAHRWAAMQTIIYLLIVRNYWRKRISIGLMSLIIVVAIVFNVGYGVYRSYTEEADTRILEEGLESVSRLDEEAAGFAGLFVSNIWNHFHGTDSLLYTRSFVKGEGAEYNYGLYILQDVPLVSIPRSLWPEKPNPSHVKFNQILRGENPDRYDPEERAGGVVQTILGELYWAGGIVGIAVGMYLIGLLCGVLYLYLLNNRHNAFVVILYAVSVVHVVTLNGSLSVTFAKWLYLLIVIAVLEAYLAQNFYPRMVTSESA